MLFIRNWNKASLDKSSNSIVTRYKGKISSLTDKTEDLRKLLGELYNEALILNERIKIDKQAIQEDLNDTATDLRETCGNSSWGQEEIGRAQDLLDRAEEDIEDIKTDVEITTGCLVVCQSGDGGGCNQLPETPCNEGITCNGACFSGDTTCTGISDNCGALWDNWSDWVCEMMEGEESEEDCVVLDECTGTDSFIEDCVVIVDGEFDCQGSDSYVDNCYGGCFGNQSCDSQTKVCPKCHGSEVDIVETCDNCDTVQKETCGTFDSQEGCDTNNDTGNCNTDNKVGDCIGANSTGDCVNNNRVGSCSIDVTGDCGTNNNAENVDEEKACQLFNKDGTDCVRLNRNGNCSENNMAGNCETENSIGDCENVNTNGNCKVNDDSKYCYEMNLDDKKCTINNANGDCKTDNNNGSCGTDNKEGNCGRTNNTGDCTETNLVGNCETDNLAGDCTRDNLNGECTSQTCEAGQECTSCIEDQKETTTTEKCKAGANIGDEEYCDTCQGDESKTEEWDQEELEDLCSTIFEGGADACGAPFSSCFNTSECDGASFGAAAGCGTIQGCGACNESDSCSGGQECATGQTCTNNDCGQDCGQPCSQGGCTGGCYSGDDCGQDCGQPCNETCYPQYTIPGGGECRLGYIPGCEEGVVCPGGTYSPDCGQWGGEDI